MKLIHSVAVALVMVAFTGCSSTGSKQGDDVVVEDRSDAGGDGSAVSTGVGSGYGDLTVESLNDPNSPLSRRVIYFEYDSADIADADQELLTQHAGFLMANPEQHITLEGSTDERGSREYNIALGDRRALSVQRILELNGVAPEQITVVSYGEEKPAAEGHSEAAWRLNRRVELVY